MNLIVTLITILVISYLARKLAKRVKIPGVVALIVIGVLFSVGSIESFLIAPNKEFIFLIGDAGLLALMFMAGMETSWRLLYEEKKDSFFIAIFSALLPFILGLSVFKLLNFSWLVAATAGICMSITAEATKARVLLGLNKLKTKVGSAMMGAGIVDDILGLISFTILALLSGLLAYRENLVVIGAIVAFFLGILVHREFKKERFMKVSEHFLIFIIPFFFISLGLHFDFNSLILNPWLLFSVVVLAIAGKLGGPFLTKRWTDFNSKQLFLIGWGMNSRGAVGLGLAVIAFRGNLLPQELYSSIVVMALLTTLTFPFIIEKIIKSSPGVMGGEVFN